MEFLNGGKVKRGTAKILVDLLEHIVASLSAVAAREVRLVSEDIQKVLGILLLLVVRTPIIANISP